LLKTIYFSNSLLYNKYIKASEAKEMITENITSTIGQQWETFTVAQRIKILTTSVAELKIAFSTFSGQAKFLYNR
jgi:hypothetical protein